MDDPPLLTRKFEEDMVEEFRKKLKGLGNRRLLRLEEMEDAVEGVNALVTNEDFRSMPSSLKATLDSVTSLSDQLQTQLASSMPKVDRVLDGAAITVAKTNEEIPRISDSVRNNLEALNQAILAFEGTLTEIDGMVSSESPTTYRLNAALQELALAARAMQQLAKTLEEQPEALIRGRRGD